MPSHISALVPSAPSTRVAVKKVDEFNIKFDESEYDPTIATETHKRVHDVDPQSPDELAARNGGYDPGSCDWMTSAVTCDAPAAAITSRRSVERTPG